MIVFYSLPDVSLSVEHVIILVFVLYITGNLYFANIQQTDDNFQEKYACLTNIMDLNVYIEGAFSYIEVLPGKVPL